MPAYGLDRAVLAVTADLAGLTELYGVGVGVGRVPFGEDAGATVRSLEESTGGLVDGANPPHDDWCGADSRPAPERTCDQSCSVSSRSASRASSASSRCIEMSATLTSSSSLPAALAPSSIMM